MFTAKKNGILRFSIVCRRINTLIRRDSYRIPRLDKCIDLFAESSFFFTLDANNGYWHVKIEDKTNHRTAFKSHHGLYQFLRMPFGLNNTPGTFQRAIDVLLASVKCKIALVYLDDIVIFYKKLKKHVAHVKQVLMLLQKARVKLLLEKCRFFSDTIDYLRSIIRPCSLEGASHTTEKIRPLNEPRNLT